MMGCVGGWAVIPKSTPQQGTEVLKDTHMKNLWFGGLGVFRSGEHGSRQHLGVRRKDCSAAHGKLRNYMQ